MCVIGLYVSLSETFSKPDYALVRVLVFALIISSAVVPLLHQIYIHGFFGHEVTNLMSGFLVMVGIYLVGSMIYAFNIPERFASGHFGNETTKRDTTPHDTNETFFIYCTGKTKQNIVDIFGHSHQWWHLCVTIAAYLHYTTLHEYLDYRMEFQCGGPSSTTMLDGIPASSQNVT